MFRLVIALAATLSSLQALACDFSLLEKAKTELKVAEADYASNKINRIQHAAARSAYFDIAAKGCG